MNDDEIKRRGQVYEQLTKYPEWEYFVYEITKEIDELGNMILSDPSNDSHLMAKGERRGLLKAITIPEDAVNEIKDLE